MFFFFFLFFSFLERDEMLFIYIVIERKKDR